MHSDEEEDFKKKRDKNIVKIRKDRHEAFFNKRRNINFDADEINNENGESGIIPKILIIDPVHETEIREYIPSNLG